ncbi:MAG: anhydro-N-acetylmuramic acid kinase [Bacteroidetes bacterium]|nr:anhydro-N-acetylmuramic acid kinase [Bacteroidota bacterium]
MIKHDYYALGLMSGTSADGLDMALCRFFKEDQQWHYEIVDVRYQPYDAEWHHLLTDAMTLDMKALKSLSKNYAVWMARQVNAFVADTGILPRVLASHGHTVFHQPGKGLTLQIGDGQTLANLTGLTTVCNFREADVINGGQGAPLVPVGDQLLFGEYEACLNIGGIANISYSVDHLRIAYDVCPANQVLNMLSERAGQAFDEGGRLAMKGSLIPDLFEKLNKLEYYYLPYPKSLGREWVMENILPLMDRQASTEDLLYTFCEHIACQAGKAAGRFDQGRMLVTGGGAFNTHLMERLQHYSPLEVVIPDDHLISFKEAIIFGFLGLRRLLNKTNVWSSVTGGKSNLSSGDIFETQ